MNTHQPRLCHRGALLACTLASALAAMPHGARAEGQRASGDDDAARAREFARRVIERYRQISAYEDRATTTAEYVDSETEAGDDSRHTSSAAFSFVRPDRIAYRVHQTEVVRNGPKLWLRSPELNQYIETTAPEPLVFTALPGNALLGPNNTNPVLTMLTQPGAELDEIFPAIEKLSSVRPEVRAGRPGHRLSGELSVQLGRDSDTASFHAWIDDQLTLREVEIDQTEAYRRHLASEHAAAADDESSDRPPVVKKYLIKLRLDDIRINSEISPDRFTFTPAPDEKRVDAFNWHNRGSPADLVGKPAPDISGADLDGRTLKLSELRGRVVVLDFWATWCKPCVESIPHVQSLAEAFKDKPVIVLGINRDYGSTAARKVRRFLEKKKITFRQFLDADSAVSKSYHVFGIPSLVLIDRDGVIRLSRTGLSDDESDEVADSINRLLRGENLAEPSAESADGSTGKNGDGDSDDETDSSASPTQAIASEFNPKQIVPQKGESHPVMGYRVQRIDVDGDGNTEIVAPGMGRGIIVINHDGSKTRRIRLQKAPDSSSIQSIAAFRDGNEQCWVVAFTTGGMDRNSRGEVIAFSSTGKRRWTYKPDVPRNRSVQLVAAAGDLDGDGQGEVVVGLSHYRREPLGERSYTVLDEAASLIILDASGNRLSQRRIGKRIEDIRIVGPADPNQLCAVLCFCDFSLRRFTFDRSAAADPSNPR